VSGTNAVVVVVALRVAIRVARGKGAGAGGASAAAGGPLGDHARQRERDGKHSQGTKTGAAASRQHRLQYTLAQGLTLASRVVPPRCSSTLGRTRDGLTLDRD
jgi:hypothetical protein